MTRAAGVWAWRLLRIAVTVSLLAWVIRRAGGAALLDALTGVSPWELAVATALAALLLVLITWRWRVLITPAPASLRFVSLLRAYLVSYFYGAFGPGTLGLDAVRTLMLARFGTGRTAAAISVTADRFVGLLGLITLGAPGLAGAATAAKGAALVPPALVHEIATKARTALGVLARQPWRVGASFAITLAAMVVWAGVGWWTLAALGHTLPFVPLVGIIAFGELMAAIPLSVQGIGVREVALAAALGVHGVPTADATLLGLLLYGQGLLLTCTGGVVVALSRDAVRPALERARELA